MGKRKRSGSFSKYDDGSKKSDDADSQEEMDGESVVIQKGNVLNGVRYSARVQEKQEKLRREASPSKQTIADSTSTATIAIPSQSTTKALGDDVPELYPPQTPFVSQPVGVPGEKKKKRTWELWSQEDKQLFFEALNEFGKDFDAIQNYLASKLKPKSKLSCNQTVAKNKDQVRHFYYRTWNKISKYLTFPKDMKKAYQEMYGLINYGELRKKQRVLNLKTAVKLSELVERGTTTIKVRGKTFRIKTPVCRALKKLNQLEDVDQIRVPCKLCVELVPHDGDTWASIQKVSHNPRVKIFVPLQRTLASLIVYLEERWKTDQNRLKEEFSLTMFGRPRTRLRLIPVENRDLSVPIFKFSEVTSATKISLNSYVQNCLHQDRKQDVSLVTKKFKRKAKSNMEMDTTLANRDPDYFAAEGDVSDAEGCEAAPENQFKITLRRDKPHYATHFSSIRSLELSADLENSNGLPDNAFWSVHEENANAAAETDAGETDYGFDDNVPSPIDCDDNTCDEDCAEQGAPENNTPFRLHEQDVKEEKSSTCTVCKPTETEDCHGNEKQDKHCSCGGKKPDNESIRCDLLDADTVTRGWNIEEAGTITLGQIYLMLGKADKLCFEYVWDKGVDDRIREDRAKHLVDKLVSVARLLKKKKTNRAKVSANQVPVPSCSPAVCAKCSGNIEASVMGDSNFLTFHAAPKELFEGGRVESPPLTVSGDVSPEDHNKTSGRPSSARTCKLELSKSNELINKESLPNDKISLASNERLDLSVNSALDTSLQPVGESKPHGSLKLGDSIISKGPESIPNASNLCSMQQGLSTQPGLIEISTLAKNGLSELDSSLRRAGANITATILPASAPSLLRSVSLADAQKAAIEACQTSTITAVGPTTTVLVSETAMFAGISPDTSTFVTIQPSIHNSIQATTTVTASHPNTFSQNIPEAKFRRPADIPILMKPPVEDRNEDGTPKVTVPKPFLDLPKGNRRIGRRPAWKQRVIIPRMLPLLPKPDATLTTLIAIPPVGLSVVPVPVPAESLTPIATLPVSIATKLELQSGSCNLVPSVVSSDMAAAVSSILSPATSSHRSEVTSSIARGSIQAASVPGAVVAPRSMDLKMLPSETPEKASNYKPLSDSVLQGSSRNSGFEESLDNLSLSSFMDISIPESTRFIASDLHLEELDCSNSSISLSAFRPGILEDSSRKNSRDPPLLDTPKKGSSSDDSSLQIPSPPQRIAPLENSWSAMNEVSDLFMGGLFSGATEETLRATPTESLSEGDLNFQSVIGDNSLDFDSKLRNFSTNLTDSAKD